jgi:probable F420-dependent oxidoreductase
MPPDQFRFGVQAATPSSAALGTQATTSSEPRWSELARRAEDHGYDVLSVPDHLDGQLAPLVGLGYAAAITERIHLGTIVLANDLRNPVLLAQEADTLAMLSGHRFELGLGAGWKVADYERADLAFEPPPVRIARLAHTIEVLRTEQQYSVPLMIGGGGRKMLALAARAADIVSVVSPNVPGVTPVFGEDATVERVRERVEWVRAQAGTRVDAIELHMRVYSAADEPQVAPLAPDDAAASPHVLVRPARAMADKLLRLRDELGFTYFTVSERFTDEFARVIMLLAKA